MKELELWQKYQGFLCVPENLGMRLDISRMMFDQAFLDDMAEPISRAFEAMNRLERGAIANADEQRMVGHYWLRAPALAPEESIRSDIEQTVASIKTFSDDVQAGTIAPERGDAFFVVLVIGIGGSALGPQFVAAALGRQDDPMIVRFIDNTDPDGIDRTLGELEELLDQTLTVVISKSGGTVETRNAMLEVQAAYARAGLNFAKHAVAVSGADGALHQKATEEHWLRIFPMWDFVGGRTSELSAVGLLPAALQGADIDAMLGGARDCDVATRNPTWRENPAALLALMWYYAGEGSGARDMVVLPYRDRLGLLGRYLQQLVMESLGKRLDRRGQVVHQGLTVYGNKGSTDQHAYVQQLREGPNNFFVIFINVLRDREGESMAIEEDVTTGSYLHGFSQGTRLALGDVGRESITITLDALDARSVGVLIALFERAVGLYAELIDVNAYHQPGVEAGKKAADAVIALRCKVLAHLRNTLGSSWTAQQIAEATGEAEAVETIHHILEHAAANAECKVSRPGPAKLFDSRYAARR